MAPEIGAGKYDRSIDIYALGAVLYELLTGMVPFAGASPSEVLLKHLSSEPDTTGIAEPFATVIKKAMAKDPSQRYASVQEMVEAVFGSEHVRQSVSVFSPDELSVIAAHAAQRVPVGAAAGGGGGGGSGASGGSGPWDRVGTWTDRIGDRIAGIGDRVADIGARAVGAASPSSRTMAVNPPVEDRLDRRQRRFLALLVAVLAGTLAAMFEQRLPPGMTVMFVALTVAGGAIGIVKGSRRFAVNLPEGDSPLAHRLATGGLAALLATLFTLFFFNGLHFDHSRTVQGTWLAILAPLLFMDTVKWADPNRKERVSFWDTVFLAGLFGYIVAMVFDGHTMIGVFTPAGICLATQLLATWTRSPSTSTAPKSAQQRTGKPPVDQLSDSRFDALMGTTGSSANPTSGSAVSSATRREQNSLYPRVPRFLRIIWLTLTLLTFAQFLTFIIASGFVRPNDLAPILCTGFGCGSASIVLLVQACRKRYTGLWSYAFKPALLILCNVPIFCCIAALASPHRLNTAESAMAVFGIVFPAIVMIATLAIPSPRSRRREVEMAPATEEPVNDPPQPAPSPSPAPSPAAANSEASKEEHPRADWTWQQWVNYGLNAQRRRQLRQQRDWWRWQRHRLRMRDRYGRRGGSSRLPSPFTVLAMILLPLAIVLTLAVALNVPEALSVGLPDQSFTNELNHRVFAGYPDWPALLLRLDRAAATLLLLLGIAAMTLGRRAGGATHIFRGLFGIGALVTAIALLGKAFYVATWSQIADELTTHHAVAAVARFLDGFDRAPLILAGVFFIFSQVLLAWPPRKREQPAAPAAPAAAAKAPEKPAATEVPA
jgi:hypothetical protein